MKKTIPISLILLLSILLSLFSLPVFAQEAENSCHGLQAKQALVSAQKKLDTAKSVVLYELNTGTMVYSYNADRQTNPTGLVKLLTVLVALESGNLDDMVKVHQSTLNTVSIGSVSAGLKSGEEISLRDLLYCIMVSSANDACAVVASHLGGDQAGFVAMMNDKARSLGCTASNFTNAHGLNDPSQYSTARDLAIIVAAALENPLFCEMFSVTNYTVAATNKVDVRNLKTTNNMMREGGAHFDSRVTGGKPAAATTTDRSMVCTAQVGDARYLCVVMNTKGTVSEDGLSIIRYGIFEEMSALLNYAAGTFEVRQILDDSQSMYQYAVANGANDVVLRPSQDVFVVLPLDCDASRLHFAQTVDISNLSAPLTVGTKVGTMVITYAGMVMGKCDLLAMTDVAVQGTDIETADRMDGLTMQGDSLWSTLLSYAAFILLGALILFALISLLVRVLRNAKIRNQQRRRARNHKRSR